MAETASMTQTAQPLQVSTPDAVLSELIPAATTEDPALTKAADDVVTKLLTVTLDDAAAKEAAVNSIDGLGVKVQSEMAKRSEMLKQPIATLARNAEDGGPVAKSLVDLRDTVEDLDPNVYDFSMSGMRRLIASVPGIGSPIRRYFSRYQSAGAIIDNIIDALEKGADQLKRDNITLGNDQKSLQEGAVKLARAVQLAQIIDQKLSAQLISLLRDDPRYGFIEQELLFPLRQRIMDLQQQQAVAQQSVITIEVIIRNNKELIRGVNRALNVTVTALQTAVTLALALENQRIVLQKIKSVNETTNNLIAGTAQRLRIQGADIHKQAASTQLDIEVLRKAFTDVIAALDDIKQFRSNAVVTMQQSIQQMDELNAVGTERIETLLAGRSSQEKLSKSAIGDVFELASEDINAFSSKE